MELEDVIALVHRTLAVAVAFPIIGTLENAFSRSPLIQVYRNFIKFGIFL